MRAPQMYLNSLYDDIQAANPTFDRNKYPVGAIEFGLENGTFPKDGRATWIHMAYKFLIHAIFFELRDEAWSEDLTSDELIEVQSKGFLRFFGSRLFSFSAFMSKTKSCWDVINPILDGEALDFSMLTAPNGVFFNSVIQNLERLARTMRILNYARIVDRHLEIILLTSDPVDVQDILRGSAVDTAQKILVSCVANVTSRERKALERLLYTRARKYGILPRTFYVANVRKLMEHPIGGGSYGDVYKGQMDGQCVAVKVSRFLWDSDTKERRYRELCKEALIWKPLEHPNVLPFLGICRDGFPSVGLVSPFMDNGDLLSYLRRNPNADKIGLVEQVCSGIEYLHCNKPEVVHGDIKCANILVDDLGKPRIADFGLARVLDVATITASTGNKGTLRWQAPELVHPSLHGGDGRANTKTDMYAFGMTCLEIFTGKSPFSELTDWEVVIMAQNGAALERAIEMTEGCDWMSLILECCCHAEADCRYQAQDVMMNVFWSPLFRSIHTKPT